MKLTCGDCLFVFVDKNSILFSDQNANFCKISGANGNSAFVFWVILQKLNQNMIMIFVFVLRILACMWSDMANDPDLDD